jgi:hypothetical protein
MSETLEFALRAVLIGAGATMVMDLWAVLLKQFGAPSLNLAFLGRWIGHLPRGRWKHPSIASGNAGPGRIVDRMVCTLLDRHHLLSAVAVDIRLGVGAIAFRTPRAVHWNRHGDRAIADPATGDGSRSRILEYAKAGFSFLQEPGHAHSLRPCYVPRRARSGFALALRQMNDCRFTGGCHTITTTFPRACPSST